MMQSTSLATAARYEEDTPAASGDKGALVLAVRNDAGGTLVNANGDYAPLQVNNLGQLVVAVVAIAPVAAVVTQPTHDLLNCNANIQVGDADVSNVNPVPVSDAGGSLTVDQATHDNLNCNANIQVGNADVGAANPVPIVGLVTRAHDFIDLGYDAGGNLTSAVYKTGGAGGVTVATLALVYDANGNLDTVTKT